MNEFWSEISSVTFDNESSVETRLLLPFLKALGYEQSDISPKHPIIFQEGRTGRHHEADFVVFSGPVQNKQTSLIVVEAKAPGKSFDEAKKQAESYVFNVRAPFYILSDGIKIQVWQFQATQESTLVIDIPVISLFDYRGKLENLLSKEAVIEYCKTLLNKTLQEANTDFSAYVKNELLRTSNHQHGITRTLTWRSADSHEIIPSTGLLGRKEGAIITGPSGFGKSTLAQVIYSQALDMAWEGSDSLIPFDVPLPELVESHQHLLKYLSARLSAHCPFVTESFLNHLLRDKGAILVCDSFDRVSSSERYTVQTELKTLLRDFPKLQLFVFSRWNTRPDLPIPTFQLDELTNQQQLEFRMLYNLDSNHPEAMWPLPGVLSTLCWHPLLLHLITSYLIRHHQLPKGITELFDSWLSAILVSESGSSTIKIDRENALSLLAMATIDKPLTEAAAIEILTQNEISRTVYDELLACDAIVVTGRTVEVLHESLSDYLRALKIKSLEDDAMRTALSSVPLRIDSLFPILLMSMLPTRSAQRLLWERLAQLDLATYLNALRFQADVSQNTASSSSEALVRTYLEDIIDGLTQPLDIFFGILRPSVIEILTGSNSSDLAIAGTISTSSALVGYQLGVLGEDFPNRINVGDMIENHWPFYGCNLEIMGQRNVNGREIGAGHLRESLLKLVKMHKLVGGPNFINERAIGRLRLLKENFGHLGLGAEGTLESIETSLFPFSDQVVALGPFIERWETFSIRELIQDIKHLRQQGMITLDQWWLVHGGMEHSKDMTEENIRFLLNEHYRRVQLAYSEVATKSFGQLAQHLSILPLLPVRWNLRVLRSRFPSTAVYFSWFPTEKWEEAGADVEFSDSPPNWNFETDWSIIVSRLSLLGRPTDRGMGIGFRPLPLFDGNHQNGLFDGETSVMREVTDLLVGDIKKLFKE